MKARIDGLAEACGPLLMNLDERREAMILLSATALLSVAHFHGSPAWLGPRAAFFAFSAAGAALFFGAPAAVIRFAFRERLADYGLRWGKPRVWGRDLAVLALLLVPAAALLSRLPSVSAAVPRYRAALAEPLLLLPATLAGGVYLFAWEFFFRGFLLFGLGRRMGRTAIFVQLVPFVMAHYPKSELEALASIGAGTLLGAIAWRGESFLGAFVLHWTATTLINALVVLWPGG